MRLIHIILLSFFFFPTALAIQFDENTTFSEGGIKYTFVEGLIIESFDITSGGIRINGDGKLGLEIEGGELNVRIYDFDDELKNISFESTVPQTLTFKVSIDGNNKYLFDEDEYIKDSLELTTDEQFYIIEGFEDDADDILDLGDIKTEKIEKISFLNKKIAEFEVDKEMDKKGIIMNKTIAITYLGITIFLFVFMIIGVVVWFFKN